MKKILSLVLALVMTISCASFAFAAPAIDEDAKNLSVYQDSIDFLAKMDLYKGGEGLSDADAITRWMMALFVARITTGWLEDSKWESSIENYSGFSDIDADLEKYLGAISYASQMGIIEGYGDGRFGPKDGIQYQQALKMLCCALGYTKVDGGYPWGYIQKAVNIGLTNVIGEQGLAPTDVLCRAEVGQLIYNALFAETAKGGTLAQNVFGKDYEWVNVMITATDKVAALNGTAKAAAGKVGFTVIENGALTEETYEAAEKLFALDANWAAEKALGTTFKVLLENGVATNAIPYATTEVTVRAGEGNIKSYVDAINGFKLQQFSDAVKYDVIDTEAGSKLAIDWTNGHILEKDGDDWKVLWYYNALLGKYFQVVENGAIDGVVDTILGEVVGIKYMTDADAAALKAKFEEAQYKKVDGNGFVAFEAKNIANYAYADLDVIDTVGAGFDRGYFKGYSFGKITVAKTHDNKNALVTITDYSNILSVAATELTACDKHDCSSHAFGWIEDASVLGANGYAIYSYNAVTGEIEIVCTEKNANFEWLTNVKLETYNTTKGTVTLDGDAIAYGYDKLDGVMFNANEQEYSEYLYKNFNQYVNVLLVDGKVVYMTLDENADFEGYIIVDGYAGFSSNGYIVVNGYNTKDLKYDQFLIESYNGWKQGDYFYNLSTAKLVETFAKGTFYKVMSTTTADGETLYNVVTTTLAEDIETEDDLSIDAKWVDYGYLLIDGEPVANKALKVVVVKDSEAGAITNFSVFEGTVANTNWKITAAAGTWAYVDDAYIIWDDGTNTITGFAKDQSNVSIVIYHNSYNTKVEYNADENKDWYILGSTKYVTKAWDIFAGKDVEVYGYNLDLNVGEAYVAVDGQIITTSDFFASYGYIANTLLGTAAAEVLDETELYDAVAALGAAFEDGYKNAKYIIGTIDYLDGDYYTSGKFDNKKFSEAVIYDAIFDEDDAPASYKQNWVSGATLFELTTDDDGFNKPVAVKDNKPNFDGEFKTVKADADGEFDTVYQAFYIYDIATKNVLVYACDFLTTDGDAFVDNTVTTTLDDSKVEEVVVWESANVGAGAANDDVVIKAEITWVRDTAGTDTLADDIWTVLSVRYFFDDLDEDDDWVDAANTNGGASLQQLINAGFHFGTEEDFVNNLIVIDGAVYNHSQDLVAIEMYNDSNYISGLTVVYNAIVEEDGVAVVDVLDEARVYDKAERDASATTPVAFSIAFGEVGVDGQLDASAEFGFIADVTLNIKNALVATGSTNDFIND